jgi:hypothetical protein
MDPSHGWPEHQSKHWQSKHRPGNRIAISEEHTMSTDNKSTDLGYMAFEILKELVSDRGRYTPNEFSALQSMFRAMCANAYADPKTVLMAASAALCEHQPGFDERLRRRVSAVATLPLH